MRFLALVLVTIWLALSVSAQEQRYALLIGNEDYPAVVGPLSLPHEDVDRIRGGLERAGFAPGNITVLKDATQSEMNLAIAEFSDRLSQDGANSVGFFYYSGHGGSAEASGVRQNYLIPSKTPVTNASQLPILGVSVGGLIDSLAAADAKAVFIVSDACRNTLPLTSSKGGESDKGMVRVNARSGLFIAFATADGATAPDDGSFSTALATQIATPGQTADRAFTLALREVANKRPGNRLPFSVDGLRGDICFAGCDAPPSPIATDEQVALGQALSSDDPAVLEEFLRRFPNSHSIGYVETRLANLRQADPSDGTKQAQARKATVMCKRGQDSACYNAAIYYATGWGVEKDMAEAARLYGIACEAGGHEACFNLALDLKSGNGIPQDQAESRRLLLKACDGGLDRACRELQNGQ
ncbi:MAG: caspase family protein [Hyphomonas sp.]|nr:caspase family protein [Hyphomonas sp.]